MLSRLLLTTCLMTVPIVPLWLSAQEPTKTATPNTSAPIVFNRDIRPILSDKCFHCHGPDNNKRKAKLRLDTKEGAFADRGGYHAVVAGKPDESELLARVLSKDAARRMPPAGSGHHLTD